MKIVLYVFGALALTGLPQWCLACTPHCRVKKAVVVTPVVAVVPAVVATFVEVPLFSAGGFGAAPVPAGAIPTAPLGVPIGTRPGALE